MLGKLRRWLGRDDNPEPPNSTKIEPRHPRSATADVLANGPRSPQKFNPKARPVAGDSSTDKLELAADKTTPEKFDPYNTGKFDRSASWERISRNQR